MHVWCALPSCYLISPNCKAIASSIIMISHSIRVTLWHSHIRMYLNFFRHTRVPLMIKSTFLKSSGLWKAHHLATCTIGSSLVGPLMPCARDAKQVNTSFYANYMSCNLCQVVRCVVLVRQALSMKQVEPTILFRCSPLTISSGSLKTGAWNESSSIGRWCKYPLHGKPKWLECCIRKKAKSYLD